MGLTEAFSHNEDAKFVEARFCMVFELPPNRELSAHCPAVRPDIGPKTRRRRPFFD